MGEKERASGGEGREVRGNLYFVLHPLYLRLFSDMSKLCLTALWNLEFFFSTDFCFILSCSTSTKPVSEFVLRNCTGQSMIHCLSHTLFSRVGTNKCLVVLAFSSISFVWVLSSRCFKVRDFLVKKKNQTKSSVRGQNMRKWKPDRVIQTDGFLCKPTR